MSANEVFHVTFFTSGDEFWVTGTDEGTATFTPDDPTGISASGHFASWFGESSNNKNDVQHNVYNLTLTNTDGSHVSSMSRITSAPTPTAWSRSTSTSRTNNPPVNSPIG